MKAASVPQCQSPEGVWGHWPASGLSASHLSRGEQERRPDPFLESQDSWERGTLLDTHTHMRVMTCQIYRDIQSVCQSKDS